MMVARDSHFLHFRLRENFGISPGAPTSTPILKNVIFTRILDNLELMYFDFLLNFSLKLTNFKSR